MINNNIDEISVYGAGGHAKVVAEVAESVGYKINQFVDDFAEFESLWGVPIVKPSVADFENLVVAIGNNSVRRSIVLSLSNVIFPALIHRNANVSLRSIIGPGTVVMAGATVNASVHVGDHCIVNTNCSIDHDCKLGDFVHISPNVGLAGGVTVGEGSHVGIGANVLPGVTIGRWCIIGAGSLIRKNVPDNCIVAGNPSKIIKIKK